MESTRLTLHYLPNLEVLIDEDALTISGPGGTYRLDHPSVPLRKASDHLSGGATEDELVEAYRSTAPNRLPELYYELERFDQQGLLERTLWSGADRLVTIEPFAPGVRFQVPAAIPERAGLSRFALMRRAGEGLVVESPLSRFRLRVEHAAVGDLLQRMTRSVSLDELIAQADRMPLPAEAVQDLVLILGGV